MKYFHSLILLCFLLCAHAGYAQNLQFYREDLTFEIRGGCFYVDGFYSFCNNGDKEIHQILFYPFPADSDLGEVDSVRARDANAGSANLLSEMTKNGLYFRLSLKPYGTCKYQISYRQKLLGSKAEYILTTTREWKKPFDNACYKLITPASLKITSTSYVPDSTARVNDQAIYYWKKKDFMPDRNFVFFFER